MFFLGVPFKMKILFSAADLELIVGLDSLGYAFRKISAF